MNNDVVIAEVDTSKESVRARLAALPEGVQEELEETLQSRVGMRMTVGLHREYLVIDGRVYALTLFLDHAAPGKRGAVLYLDSVD